MDSAGPEWACVPCYFASGNLVYVPDICGAVVLETDTGSVGDWISYGCSFVLRDDVQCGNSGRNICDTGASGR